jgi:hypothetical protein
MDLELQTTAEIKIKVFPYFLFSSASSLLLNQPDRSIDFLEYAGASYVLVIPKPSSLSYWRIQIYFFMQSYLKNT